jgi:hypothetical protein
VAVEGLEAENLAGFRVAESVADNDDIAPSATGIRGISDDAVADGVDRVAEVRVAHAIAIPVFAEVARALKAEATGLIITVAIRAADGVIEAIAERDISEAVRLFSHIDLSRRCFRDKKEKQQRNQEKRQKARHDRQKAMLENDTSS